MNLFEGMVQIKIDGAQCDDFLPVDVICVVGVRVYLSWQARHDDDDSLASSVFVGREQLNNDPLLKPAVSTIYQ